MTGFLKKIFVKGKKRKTQAALDAEAKSEPLPDNAPEAPEAVPAAGTAAIDDGPAARSWIGVDLDGTLARYDGWRGLDRIGEPVPVMLARVRH